LRAEAAIGLFGMQGGRYTTWRRFHYSEKLKVDKLGLDDYIPVVDIACLTFVIAR
jgi:hypothetical protein